SPAFIQGRYIVSPQMQVDVGRNLHNPGEGDAGGPPPTTIPSRVALRFVRDGVDADSLGLPVTPLFGSSTDGPPVGLDFGDAGDRNWGRGGVGSWTYGAFAARGIYEKVVIPQAPFDAAYPPIVTRNLQIGAGTDTSAEVSGPLYGNPSSAACLT